MKTHEYLAEAGNLLASLMENEGVLTDEDEARLEEWAAGPGAKLGAWRAVSRRAEAEARDYTERYPPLQIWNEW